MSDRLKSVPENKRDSRQRADELAAEPSFKSESHLRRNWFSYAVLLGLVVVFFAVEQVNHLFERPRFDTGAPRTIIIGLYAYLVALLLVYASAGAWVVPFNPERLTRIRGWSARVFQSLGHRRKSLTIGFAVAAGLLWIAAWLLPELPFVPDGIVLMTYAWLSVAASLTFAFWRRLALKTRRLLIRSLIALSLLNLLGELIWMLAHHAPLFSPRNYSIWAILHVFFCVFLFARVVDVWQSYSQYPVRGMAIVLVLFVIGLSAPTSLGRPRPFALVAGRPSQSDAASNSDVVKNAAPTEAWLEHLQSRITAIPDDGPVILVAASGGGSRAALFTSLVYEQLAREPISYQVNGETRTYNAADHILMISSVSGGTLASSCYLDSTYTRRRTEEGIRTKLRHSIQEEMPTLMRSEVERMQGLPWYRRGIGDGEEVVDFAALAAQQLQGSEKPLWFFERPFTDDMCTDFMAALLRGMLHPGQDRGQSVRSYWESAFGLEATNLDWLDRHHQDQSVPPVLLCNVSEVERGSRLIIGFPPLPPGFFTHVGTEPTRSWVDLDQAPEKDRAVLELSLAEATRISANFPWGFPVSRVVIPHADTAPTIASVDVGAPSVQDATEQPDGSPKDEHPPDVRFIDGGVCDNTGADSLRYVIESLDHWASVENGQTLHPERPAACKAIVDELKRRGVVLLEIDSGAKPERPGFVARTLSALLEPVRALQNAGYTSALARLEAHVDVIEESLPNARSRELTHRIERLQLTHPQADSLTPLETTNVKRLTITCNHQENVMTAWALGPTDKAQIFAKFLVGGERLRYEFAEYLSEYASTQIALDQLAASVEQLDAMESPSAGVFADVVDARNLLVESSRASKNLDSLRIDTEKAFYRGKAVSDEELQFLDDELRTKLARDIRRVPEMVRDKLEEVPAEPLAAVPEAPSDRDAAETKMKHDYQQLDVKVRGLEQSIKRGRQDAIRKIQRLPKTPVPN